MNAGALLLIRARSCAPLSLAIALLVAMVALAGCGGHDEHRGPVPQPAAQAGPPSHEPPELRSQGGVLRATLTVDERRVAVAGMRVRAKVYRGSFPGPTLRVRPGDTLELRVVNRLGEPTNLHEHGFHVS